MRLIALSLLLPLAIAHVGAAQTPSSPIGVSIERVSPDVWTATITTDHPVTTLAFVRSGDDNRIGSWQVMTEGVALRRFDRTDALVSDVAVNEISIRINATAVERGDDYTPFVAIPNAANPGRAMAVYSYYFQVSPTDLPSLENGVLSDDLIAPAHQFRFVDGAGSDVVFAGEPVQADDRITMTGGVGAYAVFGAPPRQSGANFNSLVSAGLPTRMIDQILNTVPEAINALQTALEVELDHTPSLIITRRPSERAGIYFRGGAMTSDIVMELEGDALDDPEFVRNNRGRITALVIHELAHLWNGGLVQNTDPNAAWIHEGGAEALSWEALTTVFSMDASYSMSNYQSAIEGCAAYLSEGGLAEAIDRGQRRAHYECGATIMLALSSALSPEDRAAGLSILWPTFIENSQSRNAGTYDAALFLATFAELGGAEQVRIWVRDIEAGQFEDPAAFLVRGLMAAGIEISLVDGVPVLGA